MGLRRRCSTCGTTSSPLIWGSRSIPRRRRSGTSSLPITRPSGKDARPAHVRNFLDCVKSRENPVENVEIGHYVSNIAHLGNLAFRTNSEIHWDVDKEVAIGNPAADALVAPQYREPWKLNYGRRSV